VSYGSGNDNENCGSETQPCKTIHYGINKASEGQDVLLLQSVVSFAMYSYTLPGKIFNVYGIESSAYPVLLMDYSYSTCFNFTQISQGTLNNFQVLVNSSQASDNKFFFYQNSNGYNSFIKFQFEYFNAFSS
jgi:hypothetical protein